MKNREPQSPVSFQVNVSRLPQNGMPVTIEADADQKLELAKIHGLLSVESFRAVLVASNWKRDGVEVKGRVDAAITQSCVVTMDPLPAKIEEEILACFAPEGSRLALTEIAERGEIQIDAEGPDAPEPFSGDFIDFGAVAEQFFELAIDPYPRKSGADISAQTTKTPDDAGRGPLYDQLKKLQSKP